MNTRIPRAGLRALLLLALCAGAAPTQALDFAQTAGGPESAGGAELARSGGTLYKLVSDRLYASTDNGASWSARPALPGKANSLAVAGSVLFVGTASGVHRSADGGATWSAFDGSDAGALPFVPSRVFASASHVYAIGFEPAPSFASLLYRSAAGSAAWSNVTPRDVGTNGINAAAVAGGSLCLLIGNSGVRWSSDAGSTWASASGISGNQQTIGVAADGSAIYVANSGSVSRSSNGCQSFRFAGTPGSGLTGVLVRALGVDAAGTVYAGFDDGRIRSSGDQGATWSEANSGSLPAPQGIAITQFLPSGSGMFAATGGLGLHFRGANAWVARNAGLKGAAVTDLEPLDGAGAFLVTAGGVRETGDGGASYAARNGGLPALGVGSLARLGSRHVASVFIAGNGTQPPGLALSTDGGASWQGLDASSGVPAGAQVDQVIAAGGAFYATVAFGGGIYKSSDGLAWSAVNTGLPSNPSIRNLAARGATLFAYVGGRGVFRSTDGGANWTSAGSGLSGTLFGKVFASRSAVFASAGNRVYRSTDDGASWSLTSGHAVSRFGIEILALAEDGDGHLYLGDEHAGLSVSKDGGATWVPDSDGLHASGVCIERINALIVKDGKVYAGQGEGGGVMVSDPIGSATPGDSVACTTDTDVFPDAFAFGALNNVAPSSEIRSGIITVRGLAPGVRVPISVSGGEYSTDPACAGGFTAAAATVQNDDRVCLRHTSAATGETATQTTLTIADRSASFVSRTGLVYTGRDDEINTGFGSNGFAGAAGLSGAVDVALLADGRIAAAAGPTGFAQGFGMALFRADGTLDSGFGGGDGVALIDVGDSQAVTNVIPLPDGRFLLVGWTMLTNDPANNFDDTSRLVLVRLNADGTPDATFDGDGIRLFDVNPPQDTQRLELVGDAARLADGSILVVGGIVTNSTGAHYFAVKFSADGVADTAFGDANPAVFADGVASIQVGSSSVATGSSVTVLADGRFVVSGRAQVSFGSIPGVIARFNANGMPDTTFGTNGVVALGATSNLGEALALAGGRLLLAAQGAQASGYAPMLLRLNADGTLDTNYGGGDGIVTLDGFTGGFGSLELLADGRVAALGSVSTSDGARLLYARFTAAGARDGTFGPGGQGYVLRGPVNGSNVLGNVMTRRADGGMLMAGVYGTTLGLFVFGGDGDTTPPPDTTPDAFDFTDVAGVEPLAQVQSDTVTIAGIDSAAPVTVSGGEYSIGCSATGFTSAAGTLPVGGSVCVRHAAAMGYAATTTTTLSVGGIGATFVSTTRAADTVPDAFAFTDLSGVERGATVSSNSVLIQGIESAVAISVSGGEYSIGCAAEGFTASAGSIAPGASVCVRHVAAAEPNAPTSTTLSVGGVVDTFTSTTAGATPVDTTPDAFAFTDLANVVAGSVVSSDPVTIAGIDAPAAIAVEGGEYAIGCDAQGYTANPGTILAGQSVCLRHTAAQTPSTATHTTLTVGGVTDTFSSTTAAASGGGGGSSGSVQDPRGRNVAISTARGTITNLRAVVQPVMAPSGLSYPHGFIAFDITGLPAGGSATITLALPVSSGVNAYVKCTGTTCVELPDTAVRIAGQTITLALVDGGPFDADGLANGVIQDPGAPAIKANSVELSSGNGGGALPPALLAGLLGLALLGRRRR